MLQKNAVEPYTLELLKKLTSDNRLSEFSLAGGTALALQLGHRRSIDLDLFTTKDFDSNFILEHLEHIYNFKLDFSAENTLKGSINNIKVDLISHKYKLVTPINTYDSIRLYSIPDIAAMKLNAITGNGTRSKDFIDIYFILKQYPLNEILEFYKTKYSTRNIFHVLKSLDYFDDINIQDWPEMIKENNLQLSDIKKNIETEVNDFLKENM